MLDVTKQAVYLGARVLVQGCVLARYVQTRAREGARAQPANGWPGWTQRKPQRAAISTARVSRGFRATPCHKGLWAIRRSRAAHNPSPALWSGLAELASLRASQERAPFLGAEPEHWPVRMLGVSDRYTSVS